MAWLLWLIAAVAAGIIEMLTVDLIFLMLAGGALAGMVAALAGGALWVQVLAFVAVTALLLFVVRPAAKRWMDSRSPHERTNAAALVGKTAEVVATVTDDGGRVKLVGEVWTARSAVKTDVFQVGEDVLVVAIDGAYAVVARLQHPASPTYGNPNPSTER